MSIRHIAWAFDQELKSGPKFVLVALANYADEEGICHPGQDRIAADTGQGVSTVRAHLKYLEEGDEHTDPYIERTHRHRRDGTRTSDEYRLLAPAIPIKAKRGRNNRQNPAHDNRQNPAHGNRQESADGNRQNSAKQAPESSGSLYKVEPSVEPSEVVVTTTPLNPPGESLPVVHDSPPPTPPAAIPADPVPATTPDRPAPIGDHGDTAAAITRVIIAANKAMTQNEAIDQTQLRPIPTHGRGRQNVLDWIADGVPIALILDTVVDDASRYKPDRARGQISSMGYFSASIDQANELRLAREAESHEKRNDTRGVPAKGCGDRQAPAKSRVSKYDSLTIRSGEG